MKKTLFTFLGCIFALYTMNVTPSPNTRLYTEELTAIALLSHHLPSSSQQKIAAKLVTILETSTSADECKQQLSTLQKKLEQSLTPQTTANPLHRTVPAYIDPHYQHLERHSSLNVIWQILTYCGIGCCVYLVICGLQDANAHSILNNSQAMKSLKRKNATLNAATTAASNLATAIDHIQSTSRT